jgi:flagellar biosynthesis protein FliR
LTGGITPQDWAWVTAQASVWTLVLARTLGLCLTAPAMAVPELDWRFRLMLAACLSAVLAPVVGASIETPASSMATSWAVASEILAGGFLGCSAALIVAGARAAGDLVGAQAGLATATFIDPESGEILNPIGRLYGWLALAVFLALGGPILLIRALLESYHTVPAGQLLLSSEMVTTAFAQVGRVLELALRAAAPAALALVLAGIVVGWLGRAAPSLPFTALALPLRSLTGIALVILSAAALAGTITAAWTVLFNL